MSKRDLLLFDLFEMRQNIKESEKMLATSYMYPTEQIAALRIDLQKQRIAYQEARTQLEGMK